MSEPDPLGLHPGTVRVVAYDARWPALYEEEARRVRAGLDPLPVVLEHTGSTAVPGLAAKPIVDILAGRPAGSALAPYVRALEALGWVHRGEQGIPGRDFFRRGVPRTHHLHLTEVGSAFWRDHLAFRDALRRDPALAAAYQALKLRLAAEHPFDRERYIEGKGPFVLEVLARVRR
jgi:GrpB-like predicted nucleotidyltransferase (UPF0157 family)